MNFEFLTGLFVGLSVMYMIREFLEATRGPDEITKKFTTCALEAARMDAELDLNRYSDEELVRAIASGLKNIPGRKE